jgi:2,5-diketo-D-gluconate reductase A
LAAVRVHSQGHRPGHHSSTLQDPTVTEIAAAHGKTAAQIMLRWHLQQGRSAIPKSTNPARIAENYNVFDLALTADELTRIDALDTGIRGGPQTRRNHLDAFGMPIPEP